MIRLLYIDDDPEAQRLMKLSLPGGFAVTQALTAQAGITLAGRIAPDVVLLDVGLPDGDGFDVLSELQRFPIPPPVIMLTGHGEIPLAVRSIREGAADFIEKPYDRRLLLDSIKRSVHLQMAAESAPPYAVAFLGESRAAEQIRRLIVRYAASDRPVLITGESGTGKDLVARLIHEHSPRRKAPFVPRNCGAIPDTLIESELFGSEKGAYTDAVSRPGSFELADQGTLFLDELGEMPVAAQATLLRVLETRRVQRIGARVPRAIDTRVVSATNRPVRRAIEEGALRADLFYRVSTLPIHIPPLRERQEDIPVLVQQKLAAADKTISPGAIEKLLSYRWPGNVRELHNVIERGVLLCDGARLNAQSIQFDPVGWSVDLPDVVRVEHRDGGPVVHVK